MKKFLSLLLCVLLTGGTVLAATKYNINVGGVEVTSDNYNNVTGGDIVGTVKYDPSSKTLTLTNVSIVRENSGDYALHNRDCSGLTVKFVGTCNLVSKKARSIRFDKSGTLVATSGSYVTVRGYNDGAIYVHNNSAIQIKGPGYFYIVSSSKAAIQGADQDGVFFMDNVVADIYSPDGALYNIYDVSCYSSCKVTLKATGTSSYPVVRDVDKMYFYGGVKILSPYGAYYNDSYKSILVDGNKVYNKDIYISDDYAFLINSTNFPSIAFRSYLLSLYPKGYLTQSEVNSRTAFNCSNQGISTLEGIKYFTALKELRCYSNSISSLDVSGMSNLTYLDCDDNGMTSLNVSGTALTYLDCGPNNLTTLPKLPSTVETLKCDNNKFTYINVSYRSALTYLQCSNNTLMTQLACYSCNLTSLYVSGNTALNDLYCDNNSDLSVIHGLGDCTAIKNFTCYNSALQNLSEVNNMNDLEYLDCSNTKLTYLVVTNKSKLKKLSFNKCAQACQLQVYDNPVLTELSCYGCVTMTQLYCYNNALTSLYVAGNRELTMLYCNNNSSLSTINGLPDCTSLKHLVCYRCALTSLDGVNNMTNLQELSCYYNKLSSLTLTGKKSLSEINCSYNPNLTTVKVTDCVVSKLYCFYCTALTTLECYSSSLGALDVSGNTAMTYLDCSKNFNLKAITGLGTCKALKTLYCYNCSLTTLDGVNELYDLVKLSCYDNLLTSLTVTNKSKLTELNCVYNPNMTELLVSGNKLLTTFDCRNCFLLSRLDCSGNRLLSLNVSGCSALATIICYHNQISGSDMTTLVNTLPIRSADNPGALYFLDNTNENNAMTAEQLKIARNKHWIPECFNGTYWVEYKIPVPGDINGDEEVSIADVNALIDAILSGDNSMVNDVNNDGEVSVGDINALINIILSANASSASL